MGQIFEYSAPRRDEALRLAHIVAVLDGRGPLMLSEISSALHRRDSHVRAGLMRLVALGAVVRDAKTVPPVYRLGDDTSVRFDPHERAEAGPSPKNASRSSTLPQVEGSSVIEPQVGSQPQNVLSFSKRDGTEPREKLATIQKLETQRQRAMLILVRHAARIARDEAGGDPLKLSGLLAEEAESFARAAVELQKLAVAVLAPKKARH